MRTLSLIYNRLNATSLTIRNFIAILKGVKVVTIFTISGAMMKKNLCVYLFSIIFVAPLISMESKKALQPVNTASPQTSPTKPRIRLTSNFKENYPYLVKNVYENKNLNTFAAEQFVLNQEEAIKSMNAAAKRGSNVHLTVGAHSQNDLNTYKTTTLKRDPQIHGKLTVGLDQSPTKKAPKKGILLFGSANTTNSTWKHKPDKPGAQFNFESGIEIQDDMDVITDAYKMVKSQSPMKPEAQKNVIPTTPEKMRLYGSKDTNLNKSLALRLSNAAEKKGNVAVRSMTFSEQEVADELSKFGPRAQLIVDKSALTSKGIPLLQQMHNANVSVNVFRPFKGSRAKQHAKDAIIETEDKKTYISSTANITNEGNTQRNYQLYVPNNEQVIADAKEDFEKVKKETIPFPQALQWYEKEKEEKKQKRVANKELKTIPTKKQKTKK